MKIRYSGPVELHEPVHRCQYRVIYADTDTGGVVYYGNYLRLFEIGRTEFMRSRLRVSYRELEAQGIILPVVESYVRYKAPARYDDLLEICSSLGGYSRISIRFHHEIKCCRSGRLLVRGFTIHAATDRSGSLTRLPGGLYSGIGRLAESG